MIKAITLIVLLATYTYATNIFTDVTITGTAYLTVDVLNEIEQSVLSRGTKPRGLHGSGAGAWESVASWSYVGPGEEGDIASRASHSTQKSVLEWLYWIRAFCSQWLWKGWINELPAESVLDVADFTDITHTNQVDYFIAAGLSSNGWRSATNYNPEVNNWRDFDDQMYNYRTNSLGFEDGFQSGEILGPWVIDDLQRALDYGRHQVRRPSEMTPRTWQTSTNGLSTNPRWRGRTSTIEDNETTYEGAEALAISRFSENAFSANRIRIYSRGSFSSWYGTYGSDFYNESGYRINYRDISTNSVMYLFGGTITAYIRGISYNVGDTRTFDANGLDFIVEDMFAEIGSIEVPVGTVTNQLLSAEAIADPSVLPESVTGVSTTNRASRGFETSPSHYYMIYSPNHPYTR